MISLAKLAKVKNLRKKKRVGRGYGSGKGGHTVGRGSKGQKARGKVGLTFAGTKGKKSWLKRLPLWRGKGRLKARKVVRVVNLSLLNKFYRSGEKVTSKSLVKKGVISSQEALAVKVLSQGELKKKLTVLLPCSKKAREKIIAAGGKVVS